MLIHAVTVCVFAPGSHLTAASLVLCAVIRMCMCMRMRMHMYVYVYAYVCVCVCICMCMCTCISYPHLCWVLCSCGDLGFPLSSGNIVFTGPICLPLFDLFFCHVR